MHWLIFIKEQLLPMLKLKTSLSFAVSYAQLSIKKECFMRRPRFEIDRLAIVRQEEGAQEALFYRHPAQKLYQLFIATISTSSFEAVASGPIKIVVGSAK